MDSNTASHQGTEVLSQQLDAWIRVVDKLLQLAQGNSAGFVYVSLFALVMALMLFRSYTKRVRDLESGLSATLKRNEVLQERNDNLGRSISSLWTMFRLSGDRRTKKLPILTSNLQQVLSGEVAISLVEDSDPVDERRTS